MQHHAFTLAVADALHALSLSLGRAPGRPPLPLHRSPGGRAHRRWRKLRSSGLRSR